ncbi:MAG TPA: hypothetical protein VFT95_11395 [Micromonosporaceae bacterium]|nr:hypothetical protein [Micromonosporaceae bacterium]
MKIYPDAPGAALRRLLTDVIVAAWVIAWVWAATRLYDLVQKLAVPGAELEEAGNGLADNLADVGGKVGDVPLVGDELTAPFNSAADAARALAEAGRAHQEQVDNLALALAITLLLFPLGIVLFVWLPLRVRWMRRAGAAAALRREPAGRDLLAMRALASRPLRDLARIDPDVAAKWRAADPSTVDALARLELRSLGLRAAR